MERLVEKYQQVLHEYLTDQKEAALYQASLLGRKFIETGIGPEEIVKLHTSAIQQVLQQLPPAQIPALTLDSFNLLLEVVMAYSAACREYREEKRREMEKLQLYTKKLEEANEVLQIKINELNLVYQFVSAFSCVLRLDKTANLIVKKLQHIIPYENCGLFLKEEDGSLKKLAAVGARDFPLHILGKDSNKITWHRQFSLLFVPLLMDGETFAFLLLTPKKGKPKWELRELLAIIASQAAFVLTRALMHEKTWQQSITDCKTGLLNYSYFSQQCESALSQKRQLAMMILDLDDFKSFNDRYGHLKGDEILDAVGEVLKGAIRANDLACRFGGEEFALALFNTNPSHALQIAERIRKNISELKLDVPADLTISIGIAIYPQDGITFEELFSKADKALYSAKEQGKNKVCLASTLSK